jgi:hypothetical protein
MAVGCGDVGVAIQVEQADGQSSQRCHDTGGVPDPDQRLVFLVGDIAQLLQG